MNGARSSSFIGGLFRTASAGNLARRFKARRRQEARAPRVVERKPPKTLKRDEFAELLSQDLSMAEIAHRMGITAKAAEHHFAAIRRQLGWQAK